MVHPSLVKRKDYLGWTIPYNTASEKQTKFPAARVILEVEGKTMELVVGVSQHIQEGMLMGADVPHFRCYLKKVLDVGPPHIEQKRIPKEMEKIMTTTRAQEKRQEEAEEKERLQQVVDDPIIATLDSDEEGSEPEVVTRPSQRDQTTTSQLHPVGENKKEEESVEPDAREDRTDQTTLRKPPTLGESGEEEAVQTLNDGLRDVITREELISQQEYDPPLKLIRKKAEHGDDVYFYYNNILMRKPYHVLGKDLIVLPKVARRKVLTMAHNTPWAGHFGQKRALHSIRSSMDWPGVVKDVSEMCESCPLCQKAGPAMTVKAHYNLYPL